MVYDDRRAVRRVLPGARRHRKPEEAWAAWARSIFARIPNANCFAGRFSSLLASGEAPHSESGKTIKVLTGLVLSGHAHDLASTYLKIQAKDLP